MSKPTRNRVFCPYSNRNKMVFETQQKALNHIKFNASEYDSDKVPIRAYFCSACGGWHITSQPKKKNIMRVYVVTVETSYKKYVWDRHDAIITSLRGNECTVMIFQNGTLVPYDLKLEVPTTPVSMRIAPDSIAKLKEKEPKDLTMPQELIDRILKMDERCKSNHKHWELYDVTIIAQIQTMDLRSHKTSRLGLYK